MFRCRTSWRLRIYLSRGCIRTSIIFQKCGSVFWLWSMLRRLMKSIFWLLIRFIRNIFWWRIILIICMINFRWILWPSLGICIENLVRWITVTIWWHYYFLYFFFKKLQIICTAFLFQLMKLKFTRESVFFKYTEQIIKFNFNNQTCLNVIS